MDIPSVKRQVAQARSEGIAVRGLVFINPGRPRPFTLPPGSDSHGRCQLRKHVTQLDSAEAASRAPTL